MTKIDLLNNKQKKLKIYNKKYLKFKRNNKKIYKKLTKKDNNQNNLYNYKRIKSLI